MRSIPLTGVITPEQLERFKYISENAQGKTLELSAAPTATNPKLRDGEVGQSGDYLYFRIANKIYRISATVTTITNDEV